MIKSRPDCLLRNAQRTIEILSRSYTEPVVDSIVAHLVVPWSLQ
jgi:hypothetical protein